MLSPLRKSKGKPKVLYLRTKQVEMIYDKLLNVTCIIKVVNDTLAKDAI